MILFAFLLAPTGISRVPDGNETVKKQAVGAKFVDDITAVVRQAECAAERFHHGF
jgi:hypothetical protein